MSIGIEMTEENYVVIIFEGILKAERVMSSSLFLYLFVIFISLVILSVEFFRWNVSRIELVASVLYIETTSVPASASDLILLL